MPDQTPEEALMAWAQFRQLGMTKARVTELAPFLLERLKAIDALWGVDVGGVEPAVSFSVDREADVS